MIAHLKSQAEYLEQMGCSNAATIHFARAVLGMHTTALACDACQDALPEQIESELNNLPGPDYRTIRHHLDLCTTCATAYIDLLEIALLAEEGSLPRSPLAVDLSFLEQPSGRSSCDA